jgi:hypothetical protein
VSQPYLSLMESGRRPVPPTVVTRLAKHTSVPATALPLRPVTFDPQVFAASLGALGYPRFAYLANSGNPENPALLVLTALQQDELEARLTEALPWVLLHFPMLDWPWLIEHVKRRNLQNRLGFLVTLAKELAEKQGLTDRVGPLNHWENELEDARLAKVDVLARRLTSAERRYFQAHRPASAAHWNLLTGLTAETLRYA